MRALLRAAGLVISGGTTAFAWSQGFWGLCTASVLIWLWLSALNWLAASPAPIKSAPTPSAPTDISVNRLLLDAAPTPMVAIRGGRAHALNRAARLLFATDDRILPAPDELIDPDCSHFRDEGRHWRIDRVTLDGMAAKAVVITLIDVEREDRAAEARATTEVMQVLGHELLNGLAPIVSLSESGLSLLDRPEIDPALLREILGTLARLAEGLQRFTEAYRTLARLPAPLLRPVAVRQIADDMSRLFAVQWPQVRFVVQVDRDVTISLDRDQIGQALWALLQNAAEAERSAHENGADVLLSFRASAANLEIEISDNGKGIEPECSERIFRPFFSTKTEGSGVGLSLAQQIIHAHGGSLTLERSERTTFRASVPIVQLSPSTAKAPA
ncbi:sensor histidine kinase [Stakelama marina]|nr:ATP-binding protein [Stakelama marina]